MKKTVLIVTLLVLAIGSIGVGVAFAQDTTPPQQPFGPGYGHGMMGAGGVGPMHTYVAEAFAAKLGIPVDEINLRLAAGETMYQIALAEGITEADLPVFLAEVHESAFGQAVQAGVLTQAQADWMLERMRYRIENGFGPGSGHCDGTGPAYQNNAGQARSFGRGMMGRGFRFQQTP